MLRFGGLFSSAKLGRTMEAMTVISTDAIRRARDRVARSAQLMDRQEAIIRTLERSGADTRLACALLYTMYRSRLLMTEHLDQLNGVDHASCDSTVSEPTDGRVDEQPPGSLDDWLQLLTLATYPHQGPNGAH